MFRSVTVIGLMGIAGTAMAEPVRMTGDDIKRAMPGALLEIDTPLRLSIPVKVGSDGLMSAEAGALGLTLGATKDRGRWWTDGDKLCMKWFRWFDAKPRCMALRRDGNKVYWAEGSGENGTATITEAQPIVAAAPAPRPPKKEKRVEVAAAAPPADPAPLPTESAAVPAPEETPAPSDTTPALQFAAAALVQAMPKPAPVKPSKLGMNDAAPDAQAPAPVAPVYQDAAAPEPEVSAPRAEENRIPKQRKVKSVAVASRDREPATAHAAAPVVRKSTPVAHRSADPVKPTPASFRVAGVVAGDTLNVRSGPSEYHPAVGGIPATSRGVKIVGACRDLWCPIRHGKLSGWVNRFYLAEDVALRR
jgi:hypothetical protein